MPSMIFKPIFEKIPTDADVTLTKDALERIVRHHIVCGMGIDETYA